ncbi:hypothetical protein DM01DRAFT_1392085 [Hesseltinella vesiculosa]|uniref:Uncharacterized protein n=1 Tax=Hesseltinella vesiculosa TaxID=101127 RepID=A0A1X2GVA1_9FUNG|nr:hypothetical protein DM01DRAFT_1392085 [Hesseltinella vesiculosa]
MFSKRKSLNVVSPGGSPNSKKHTPIHRWKKWLTPRFHIKRQELYPPSPSSTSLSTTSTVSLSSSAKQVFLPPQPPSSSLPMHEFQHRWTMDMAQNFFGSPVPPPPRKARYRPPPTCGTALLTIPEN